MLCPRVNLSLDGTGLPGPVVCRPEVPIVRGDGLRGEGEILHPWTRHPEEPDHPVGVLGAASWFRQGPGGLVILYQSYLWYTSHHFMRIRQENSPPISNVWDVGVCLATRQIPCRATPWRRRLPGGSASRCSGRRRAVPWRRRWPCRWRVRWRRVPTADPGESPIRASG